MWGETMENPHRNARFFGFFVVGVIGVWLTINMLSAWYWSLASLHWTRTSGQIIASSIESGTTTLGNWWAPSVRYEYAVGTATFRADKIRFYIPFLRDRAAAESIRAPYAVGEPVRVAYDPDNPARSVLEPGFRQGIWKPSAAAMLFWSVAAILFYDVTNPGALAARLRLALNKDEAEDEDADDQTEEVA
jgi:hypothetical protein